MQSNTLRILKQNLKEYKNRKIIFLCIGTNSCIGDSLGPQVGEILSKQIQNRNIQVYGNLRNNLHHENICNVLNKINYQINMPYVIVVDSALSHEEYIGNIIINKKKMIIGEALKKKEYKIGNISIKGIVGKNNRNIEENINTLKNVPSETIAKLSKGISNQILQALPIIYK